MNNTHQQPTIHNSTNQLASDSFQTQAHQSSSSKQETTDSPTSRGNNISSLNRRNIPSTFSFKEQKKSYNLKKRFFTRHIQSAIESSQEIHSGWLKARTAFKQWTKVWCQVKPGYLVLYTSQEAQKKYRLGVVLLSICQLIKRPTKKEGFCFKLTNPFGCSVWAKSSTKALAFSQASLTLRASDSSIGKVWLDALHQCNLSDGLDGCQSIVEPGIEADESMQSNRSDISDSDDGDINTRQLGSVMLNPSNNSSNNNSTSSLRNYRSSDKLLVNGNALLGNNSQHAKDSHSNLSFVDENSNKFLQSSTNDQSNGVGLSSQLGKYNNRLNNICNYVLNNGSDIPPNKPASSYKTTLGSGSQGELSMNSTKMVAKFSRYNWKELQLEPVNYIIDKWEELGSAGVQSEEVHDSNKNFLWHIIKQLRPGMDLSKVTLPTFILEPRSFLEKLADYYYHCDILSEAVLMNDPMMRLINIVKWYLSGFYKKPKGPKKPYNPILGERFRCFWDHPKSQSRTFFVAEQVSHHPPISAFHVSNRKDGYAITCALLSRSKFSGNSVSAILDGRAKLYLSKRKETYTLTMPYANCRGILLGSLCLELGGKVEIECAETACRCELDFKLAPVWASSNSYNALTGRILRANKVTHTLEGHWDKKINIIDKATDEKSVLWEVTDSVRGSRLKRFTVSTKDQGERESVKLWSKVTEALQANDQTVATTEKTRLEDMQRQEARDRKSSFMPEHFVFKPETNEWCYRWQDDRAWDDRRDIMQFEDNFKIRTLVLKGSTSVNFNPNIDLPLSEEMDKQNLAGRQAPGVACDESSDQANDDQLHPEAFKSIHSKIDNENMLIKQAIKQVTEKNKRLEEEMATLRRGKRASAFVIATIIVAMLSVIYKYLS